MEVLLTVQSLVSGFCIWVMTGEEVQFVGNQSQGKFRMGTIKLTALINLLKVVLLLLNLSASNFRKHHLAL